MKALLTISIALFLSSCTASYQQRVLKPASSKLDRGGGVFISTPKNGWYGNTEYKNSGKMTANAVKAAFARFSNNVYISEECLGPGCLKGVPADKYAYYVAPEVLHWEDRATEWSGIPDQVEIKIVVYDTKSGAEVASSVLTGKSKWATFGGDHPQDLLPEPLNRFVESLY
ncbi:MAG TPA: DUF4823 domain-containing protein [Candidatus Binatia bacterium]